METKKPVHSIRLGKIVASIWAGGGEDAPTRHNVTVARLYKEVKDKHWKRSTSFGRDDLLVVAKVLDLAQTWIFEQSQNASEQEASDE